jgi:VanZ family protein
MKNILNFWKTITWVVFMLLLFLIPSPDVPNIEVIPYFDKMAHVVLFTVFTMLYLRDRLKTSALKTITPGYIFASFLFVFLFSAMVEILQEIMNVGREGDIIDICYDFAGFLFGLLVMILLYGVRSRSL